MSVPPEVLRAHRIFVGHAARGDKSDAAYREFMDQLDLAGEEFAPGVARYKLDAASSYDRSVAEITSALRDVLALLADDDFERLISAATVYEHEPLRPIFEEEFARFLKVASPRGAERAEELRSALQRRFCG
ncbi:MAG: hypothetical protein Tsb0020_05470 [Haliangiales bacterium]